MASVLILHGYPVSNWFNCARAALIEKGLAGEYVPARASQEEDFLVNSAMGKIPWLETAHGGIAETVAILDYLEAECPVPSLVPSTSFERARMREVLSIIQLYLEAPLRMLYPAVFMGAVDTPCDLPGTQATVERALGALDRVGRFAPYFFGDVLTQADLVLFYTLELGERVAHHMFDCSLFDGRPALSAWDHLMRERESTRVVLADFAPAFADYLAQRGAAWDEAAYEKKRH